MPNFTNIVRAKKMPVATAKALGIPPVIGENRLEVKAAATPGEESHIYLRGTVGCSWMDESGITEKETRNALDSIPRGQKIRVHVNSEGGSCQEGLGIYSALKDRKADTTCVVDGYALSIACIFPLGAGRVISPRQAIWMMHKAWSLVQGDSEDMRKQCKMLEEHDEALAEILSEETGQDISTIRRDMKAETWIRGSQAVAYGLADEGDPDENEDPNAENAPGSIMAALVSRCSNVPQPILNAFKPQLPASQQISQGADNSTHNSIMDKIKILALLKDRGINVPENATDEQILALLAKPTAAAPVVSDSKIAEFTKTIEVMNAALAKERQDRIERTVDGLIVECKLTLAERPAALARAVKDETYLDDLKARPAAKFGGEGLGVVTGAVGVENGLEKIFKDNVLPNARFAAMRDNWESLISDAKARDGRGEKPKFIGRCLPSNLNTVSSTLVTAYLAEGSVTPLQNILAPLNAFTRDFSMDPYKPRSTVEIKFISAGSTTLTIVQGTSFEQGDATFEAKAITVGQYSQPFQINNFDLQGGMRLSDLMEINAQIIGNKIIELATAPITVANFPNPIVSAPGAFGWSDMAGAWALLKKSTKKSAILDGEYVGMLMNTPMFFQQGLTGNPSDSAVRFGWNGIYTNTDWTGAEAGVRGFFCAPQAIGVVAGMPLEMPGHGNVLASATFQVPGVGITIATHNWLSLATRTMWQSYDVMFGASVLDTTAGLILKSA